MLTVGRNVENVGKSESQPAAAAVSGRNPRYFVILSCFFFLFHFSAFVLTFVCSFGRFGWFLAPSLDACLSWLCFLWDTKILSE